MNKPLPQTPEPTEMEQFRRVLASDIYTLLADIECKDILTRLSDGQISVGKCIEAIAEVSLGIKPRLATEAAQDSPEGMNKIFDKWDETFKGLADSPEGCICGHRMHGREVCRLTNDDGYACGCRNSIAKTPEGLALPPISTVELNIETKWVAENVWWQIEPSDLEVIQHNAAVAYIRDRQLMDALRRATEAEGRCKELEADVAGWIKVSKAVISDLATLKDRTESAEAKLSELQTLLDAKNAALIESDKERNKWYDIAQEVINGK